MKLFERLTKEQNSKRCVTCGGVFVKPKDYGNKMWLDRKYCSRICFNKKQVGHTAWNKGKSNSVETRLKISKANKGKKKPIRTDEHKRKLGLAHKGKPSWSTGKKGIWFHTEEWKRELGEKMKGNKYKVGLSSWNKGLQGYKSGELNNMWRGGVSKINKTERQLAMQTIEYKLWRSSVFERDNFTCVECKAHGVRLEADHIKQWRDFPELRYDINNGRTLCRVCHQMIGWSLFKQANPMKVPVAVLNNI